MYLIHSRTKQLITPGMKIVKYIGDNRLKLHTFYGISPGGHGPDRMYDFNRELAISVGLYGQDPLVVTKYYAWVFCLEVVDILPEQVICHCGRPAHYHYDLTTHDNEEVFTRGLCQYCDSSRCDADPTDCPFS